MEDRDGKAPLTEDRYTNDQITNDQTANNQTDDGTAPTKVVSPGYVPSSTTSHLEAQPPLAAEPVVPSYQSDSSQKSGSFSEQASEQANATHRLRNQVYWLKIALTASVLVLGGALAGIFWGIRQEQMAIRNAQGDLSAQVETLEDALPQEEVTAEDPSTVELPTVTLPSGEQLNRVEEQLRTLNEQTKALSEQARDISEQLPDVSFDQWTQLQERLAALEEDIQNNLPDEAISARFERLSERLKQLLNQPQSEPVEPTETETAQ